MHHDPGRSWDMDDVRSFYMREVFGVDPLWERYSDAERALDLGRATNAYLMQTVFTEWRCNERAGGGLVLGFNDVAPGAGWGLDRRERAPQGTVVRHAAGLGADRRAADGRRAERDLRPRVQRHGRGLQGELVVELFANGENLRRERRPSGEHQGP